MKQWEILLNPADKSPWLLLPISHAGGADAEGEQSLVRMLHELGMEAPRPAEEAPEPLSLFERYLMRLPGEVEPFMPAPVASGAFNLEQGGEHPRQGWFVRLDDSFSPDVELEMEVATDRSGARRNDRRGIFWLVGGEERMVYVWDGAQIVQSQPVSLEDGGSLVYDPDMDNLFVVSDSEERLYVFTVGRRERKHD